MINKDFNTLVNSLTNPQFWCWVSGWIDIDMIRDTYNNWDDDEKKEEIKNIKLLLKDKTFRNLK